MLEASGFFSNLQSEQRGSDVSIYQSEYTENKDWKAFVRGYNGIVFANNNYDVKLANVYKKWNE
jgi:hypothetical protein